MKRAFVMSLGLLLGIVIYALYDLWKFPPGTKMQHGALMHQYYPVFSEHSSLALAALSMSISPAAGALWYFPPLLLCIKGLRRFVQNDRRFVWSLLASIVLFVGFICSISFFKGDPAWGPRYLTPLFAVLWLFSADGAARLRAAEVGLLLVLGFVVQLAALSVDPYRLYINRGLPSTFGAIAPALYFDPANAHLLNRPRELVQIWVARREPGLAFTPWAVPTATLTTLDKEHLGPAAVANYKVLNSFRPWWASQPYVRVEQRPVSIPSALAVFAGMFAAGSVLILAALLRAK